MSSIIGTPARDGRGIACGRGLRHNRRPSDMSGPSAVPDGFDPRVRGPQIAAPPAASLPAWVEAILEGSPVVPLRGRGGRPDVLRRDANGWRQISTAVA